jgi:glucokinase
MPSSTNNQIICKNLSWALSQSLKTKRLRTSSAALANEFNLRALGVSTISSETMRKWRSGSAMPSPGHLVVLRDWLGLDLNVIFSRVEQTVAAGVALTARDNKPLSPNDALESLDETIKVLLDTRKTISAEMRKLEKRSTAEE